MSQESVLHEIAIAVQKRLDLRKENKSLEHLLREAEGVVSKNSLAQALERSQKAVISEIKFKSPALNREFELPSPERAIEIAGQYVRGGATAFSILTEEDYFKGSPEILKCVRKAFPDMPILMKDFILEEYQIAEAKLLGANCILLIVALLGSEKTKALLQFSQKLGLDALVEVHDEEELSIAKGSGARLIGINNRNLKNLKVNLETSVILSSQKSPGEIWVSESGIETAEEVTQLNQLGYTGFLIGSALMKNSDPVSALRQLLK